MDDRVRPDDLEEAGHDVDLDVELVEVADELQQVVLGVARERDDDALDVERSGRAPGAPPVPPSTGTEASPFVE